MQWTSRKSKGQVERLVGVLQKALALGVAQGLSSGEIKERLALNPDAAGPRCPRC
jgi:hypothetical protein